LTAQTFLTG